MHPEIYWKNRLASPSCPDIDKTGFVFKEGDFSKNWTNTEDIRIFVFHAWTATWHHIRSINFTNDTVFFNEESHYPVGEFSGPSGHRYIVENVAEELDAPGEWFYDKTKRTILFFPPSNLTLNRSTEFVVPNLQNILSLTNVENVFFHGLSFQFSGEGGDDRQSDHSLSGSVQVTNSSHIHFHGCEFRHTGATGLSILSSSSNIFVNSCR